MTTEGMRFATWTTETTDTHSEYVTPMALPLQQWLCERTSVLRLRTHCLSIYRYPEHKNMSVLTNGRMGTG